MPYPLHQTRFRAHHMEEIWERRNLCTVVCPPWVLFDVQKTLDREVLQAKYLLWRCIWTLTAAHIAAVNDFCGICGFVSSFVNKKNHISFVEKPRKYFQANILCCLLLLYVFVKTVAAIVCTCMTTLLDHRLDLLSCLWDKQLQFSDPWR